MNSWKPIKTAPKDGTIITAWSRNGQCPIVTFFSEGHWREKNWNINRDKPYKHYLASDLTHWFIPKPPKDTVDE